MSPYGRAVGAEDLDSSRHQAFPPRSGFRPAADAGGCWRIRWAMMRSILREKAVITSTDRAGGLIPAPLGATLRDIQLFPGSKNLGVFQSLPGYTI